MMNNEQMKDKAYTERAMVAVMLAKVALRQGYLAGVGDDDKSRNSTVLYIQLPEGQVSYHISANDTHLLEGLPTYQGKWDGTFNGRNPEFVKNLHSCHVANYDRG